MTASNNSKKASHLCYCGRCAAKHVIKLGNEITKPKYCPFCGKSDEFNIDKTETKPRS